jgi:hypothetical protein
LLIPLFDIEKDLGAYGYYGYNKTKVIIIKTLEVDINLEKKLSNIYLNYTNMIMNPFFNKKLLEDGNDNNLKNKFINDVVNIIKN